MPCTDGGPSFEQVRDTRNVPAMLCALATALEAHGSLERALSLIDWSEAGVTRQWFDYWWSEHKREDEGRRFREGQRRIVAETREKALAKLSPEERAALNQR